MGTVYADALSALASLRGQWFGTGGFVHIPAHDKTFYCNWNDGQGVLKAKAELTGDLCTGRLGEGRLIANARLSGSGIPGNVFYAWLKARGKIAADAWTEVPRCNWVGWSKIGEASFELDLVNDAGYAPMEWLGWVYQVKPLGKNIVVYGESGITMMTPVESPAPTFGFSTLAYYGLLAKNCVTGNNQVHIFINSQGQLCELTPQGIKILGYEEFLYPLRTMGTPPVMLYDEQSNKTYIANGTVGYVWNGKGLGGGPPRITGVYAGLGGVQAVYNPSAACPSVGFKTELMSLGSREMKVVQDVKVVTAAECDIWCRVWYRTKIGQALQAGAWAKCNSTGIAYINPVSCLEFQIEVKLDTDGLTEVQVDDLQINLLVPDNVQIPGEAK